MSLTKFSILIVDDDVYILQSIGPYLETCGYEVRTISDPAEALALLDRKSFDLVITDLLMGDVDGISVLRKAKEADPLCQVMILTGYGDLTSAIEALRLEADDYLLKPCELEEIQFKVEGCIETLEVKRKIKIYESQLPICSACKKIQDAGGSGEWVSVEHFIYTKAGINPSSTYCPSCLAQAQKEMEEELNGEQSGR